MYTHTYVCMYACMHAIHNVCTYGTHVYASVFVFFFFLHEGHTWPDMELATLRKPSARTSQLRDLATAWDPVARLQNDVI